MRRDHFTLSARNTDSEGTEGPILEIRYDGPTEALSSHLTDDSGDLFTAADIDAAFRLQKAVDDDDATGVFSLTHRVTGEFLLEANVDATEILSLVRTTRDADEDDASYRIRIERDDDDTIVYELDSLLVYDLDGGLLRQNSLIPSGVEL